MIQKLHTPPFNDLTTLNAIIDGGSTTLSTPEAWGKLRAAAQEGQDVQLLNVPTFRRGWNRNGVDFAPKAMGQLAAAKDIPHLLGHDSSQVMGRVTAGRLSADGDTLLQDLDINTDIGHAMLATGIRPLYSVHWDRTEETEHQCSNCGGDIFTLSGDCPHYPTQRLPDGEIVQVRWTSVVGVETSQEFKPAVPDTGLSAMEDIIFSKRLALAARSTTFDMGATMPDKTPKTPKTPDNPPTSSEVLAEQLAAKDTEIATLKAQYEQEQVDRLSADSLDKVNALRAAGTIQLPEGVTAEQLAASRCKNPEMWDLLASAIPTPKRPLAGSVVAPVAPDAPEPTMTATDFHSLADRCAARLKADPTLDRTAVWTEERKAMRGVA